MLAAALLLWAIAAPAEAAAQAGTIANDQMTETRGVLHLRGLDTLNGTTRDIDLPVGDSVTYGHLEIAAGACRVPAATPEADAYAFLTIRDVREPEARFSGWMFASSPALSALDHPRYDIWVLGCSNR